MSEVATLQHPATGDWEAILSRIQRPALLVGAVGLLLAVLGLFIHPDTAYRSYLWAFLFWAGIPLGSLGFLMIQHLTGGMWGFTARRFFEASSWLILLTAVFAVPIILVVATRQSAIYPWLPHGDTPGQYGHVVNEAHLWFKKIWLSPALFILRTVLYFAVWIFLSQYLYAWSGREDRNGSNPRFAFRGRLVAAPGIVIYFLAMYFAFVDWVMSIDPQWYSTMFGVLYIIGSGLTAMAFTIVVISLLYKTRPLRDLINPGVLNDLGNLTFAFLMLWAYMNFSQLLIQWSGNLSEETPYYYFRTFGSWGAVAIFIVVFHFFTPFFLLIWRKVKRDMKLLAMVAVGLLFVRSVDLFWIVKPMFSQRVVWMHPLGAHGEAGDATHAAPSDKHDAAGAKADPAHGADPLRPGVAPKGHDVPVPSLFHDLHWTDLPAWVGIGGIWVAAFAWKLKQRPIVAPNDPRMARVSHGHH